jgi:hypothetical protein
MALRSTVPDAACGFGGLAACVVTEVDGAHLDSLGTVGHAVPLVGSSADAVGVLNHGTVDLERSECATIVPDGKVVARGLDED